MLFNNSNNLEFRIEFKLLKQNRFLKLYFKNK